MSKPNLKVRWEKISNKIDQKEMSSKKFFSNSSNKIKDAYKPLGNLKMKAMEIIMKVIKGKRWKLCTLKNTK